eukprot:403361662
MKKICLCLLIVLLSIVNCQTLDELREGVLILSDNTFDMTIEDHPFTFVLFTNPSCHECHLLDPEFRKAGKEMAQKSHTKSSNQQVIFAIVDTHSNPVTAQQHKIYLFPALVLFSNRGKSSENFPIQSLGGAQVIKAEDYIRWLVKRVYQGVKLVTSEKELRGLIQSQNQLVVYIGDTKREEFKRDYSIVAKRFEQAYFIRIEPSNKHLVQLISSDYTQSKDEYQVIMIQTERNDTYQGKLELLAFEKWLALNSLPNLIFYDMEYYSYIFHQRIPTIFLFISSRHEEYQHYLDEYQNIAEALKSDHIYAKNLIFAVSDISNLQQKQVADMIGITLNDCPLLVYLDLDHSNQIRYNYLADIEDIHDKLTYEHLSHILDELSYNNLQLLQKVENQQFQMNLIGTLYHFQGPINQNNYISKEEQQEFNNYDVTVFKGDTISQKYIFEFLQKHSDIVRNFIDMNGGDVGTFIQDL